MPVSSQSVKDSIADAATLARIAFGWGVLADMEGAVESTLELIACPCGGIDCVDIVSEGARVAAHHAFRAVPGLR